MTRGRCSFCGELIPTVITSDGAEVASCMHILEMKLTPSQYEMPISFSGIWICHPCFSKMVNNTANNALNYNTECQTCSP